MLWQMYTWLYVKYPLCFKTLIKVEFSRQIFEKKKCSNFKFGENPSRASRFSFVLTGRHDEAISRFSQNFEKRLEMNCLPGDFINTSIRLWTNNSCEILCCVFMKSGIYVICRRCRARVEFQENRQALISWNRQAWISWKSSIVDFMKIVKCEFHENHLRQSRFV